MTNSAESISFEHEQHFRNTECDLLNIELCNVLIVGSVENIQTLLEKLNCIFIQNTSLTLKANISFGVLLDGLSDFSRSQKRIQASSDLTGHTILALYINSIFAYDLNDSRKHMHGYDIVFANQKYDTCSESYRHNDGYIQVKNVQQLLNAIGFFYECRNVLKAITDIRTLGPRNAEFKNKLEIFEQGYQAYLQTGNTPHEAYMAMRQLYDLTNGSFNDYFKKQYAISYPPIALQASDLKSLYLDIHETQFAVNQLGVNGIYQLHSTVNKRTCERIREFALHQECLPLITDEKDVKKVRYDPRNPQAIKYHFDESTVMNNHDVQTVVSDPLLIEMAQQYLGCQPVLNIAIMWWTTTFDAGIEGQSKAAQQFHYDMDTMNFFKVIIYLTNVNSYHGPHCYVRGSHLKRPLLTLRDGRHSDATIAESCGRDNIIEFIGPQGTILIADTRGLHKGKTVTKGHRLVLQLQFSTSLFGDVKTKRINLKDPCSKQLLEINQKYPRVFSRYNIHE